MKKQKGMTLMEIVISMAIYAILALLAVQIMTSMNTLMRVTNQLNDRLSYEAKYADNLQTDKAKQHNLVSYQVTYNNGTPVHGGAALTAQEHTMGYDDTRVNGTNYVVDMDYRFMTFGKFERTPSECPPGPFIVHLRLVPYFSDAMPADEATKVSDIKSAKAIIDSAEDINLSIDSTSMFDTSEHASGTVHDPISLKDIGLGGDLQIKLENKGQAILPESTETQLSTTFKITGNRQFYDGDIARRWIESDVQVYMYVQVGSSTLSRTFYNQCVIEFNVNTGEFKAFKSLTESENPGSFPDAELIANN